MTNKEELRDSIKDIEIAKLFHDTYERLAPEFGYETRKDTKEFDPFSENGRLMIESCRLVIEQIRKEDMERVVDEIKKFREKVSSELGTDKHGFMIDGVLSIIKQENE